MAKFFDPPQAKPLLPKEKIDKVYKSMRFKVFMGSFLGYAAYYLVRKNLSLASADMIAEGLIDKQGVVYTDEEGDLVTSIVNGKDCVFTCYDEKGSCYCAIEKAYRAGKVNFCKPVSCALYPIRVGDYGPYKAVNYHRWDVCKAAVLLGQKENLPVYKFLKEPLIRKFGEEWYKELEIAAEELKNRGLI